MKNIIIGSGPAGVSAAAEILESGKEVAILDASVFPDVPGSPTTFNIAINSTRMISNLINEERI